MPIALTTGLPPKVLKWTFCAITAAKNAGVSGYLLKDAAAVLRAQAGPIRLGFLTVKTGPLASGGIDMDLALTMFLKERNSTLAGRKVELIVADTAGVPATARTKAQELVEKNNVHCIIGPLAAFEALDIADHFLDGHVLMGRRRDVGRRDRPGPGPGPGWP